MYYKRFFEGNIQIIESKYGFTLRDRTCQRLLVLFSYQNDPLNDFVQIWGFYGE